MQDRGMQVVHVNSMLRCIEAKVIAFTKRNARLNATSRQPHREAIRVMVATIVAAPLHHRRAAELTAPDNERIVQKSALLESLTNAAQAWSVCWQLSRMSCTRLPCWSQAS